MSLSLKKKPITHCLAEYAVIQCEPLHHNTILTPDSSPGLANLPLPPFPLLPPSPAQISNPMTPP